MGMSDNPVGKVDQSLERQRGLHRTLQTCQEVKDHARVEIANREVRQNLATTSPDRPEKVDTTVVTTSSTAIVEMIAPYCRNIGIGV